MAQNVVTRVFPRCGEHDEVGGVVVLLVEVLVVDNLLWHESASEDLLCDNAVDRPPVSGPLLVDSRRPDVLLSNRLSVTAVAAESLPRLLIEEVAAPLTGTSEVATVRPAVFPTSTLASLLFKLTPTPGAHRHFPRHRMGPSF